MTYILVINAGSSSLKYQLIDMDGEKLIAKGICERIGIDGKISGNTFDGREFKYSVELKNHTAAFLEVEKVLTSTYKVIDDLSDTEIEDLNIPAGHPLAYDVDHLGHARPRGGRYLDDAAATVAAARVAAEGGT